LNEEFPVKNDRESVLTYEQVYQFLDQGYLHARALVGPEICRRADDTMLAMLGTSRDDRSTWGQVRRDTFTEHPELMGMYTPSLLRAAGQLASEDPHMFPVSRVPTNAYIIAIPPSDEPWKHHGGHMDGAGDMKTNIVSSFPPPWSIFAMIYLHDVESQGGATMVWPGSHRKFQSLLRSQPERYKFMAQLAADADQLDLGEPVELLAQAGDVLFVDQKTWHAGSRNKGYRPRLAMNMKW